MIGRGRLNAVVEHSLMHIGIAFDLKSDHQDADRPDDWQEEFDSPVTVHAIAAALRKLGHTVSELGDGRGFVERMLSHPPDLVFNIAEGEGVGRSREARVPAVCEMLGIPHTGSDPLTLAATLDKPIARTLVASAGVKVPWGRSFVANQDLHTAVGNCPWPVIVKPAWEGSSKGIRGKCVARTAQELTASLEVCRDYEQPILVEEFIQGEEITVGVVGNHPARILGIMRVVPLQATEHFVYSLEVKRDYRHQVRYECPAALAPEAAREVERATLQSYDALGCRDLARIDFRVRDGRPYFIEANPLPGLNPESSDLVLLANAVGISHDQLIGMILDAAVTRIWPT